MTSLFGFTMAQDSPSSIAIVKKKALIIGRCGSPNEIFDTPSTE